MGLLDRWKNKKKEQQLEDNAEKVEKKQEKAEIAKEVKEVKEPVVKAAGTKEKKETKVAKTTKAKKEVKKEETEVTQRAVKSNEIAYKILIKPLVTEKAAIAESLNKYSFVVARNVNKFQVKQAVNELYGVMPVSVNIMNNDGRRVRFGGSQGRRSDFKKAIVTLPAGKTITIHEGV